MTTNAIKRKLGWLEGGLYAGGVILIAVFFYIRGDANRQAEEGMEAFRQSLEAPPPVQVSLSEEAVPLTLEVPDQALWADNRIRQYEESLKVEAGPPLGILTIEHLDIQVPVYNGTDEFNLNRGVGRIMGTAQIDETGNLGIAGHRDGFFRGLKDIGVGDEIVLQSTRGLESYAVSSIEIVDPSDVSVLANTPDRTLTLVTCYPFYFVGHAPERFIVKATAKHSLVSNK
mgnify:FL=1